MRMNPLAGLLPGNSHNGRAGPLSERDVIAQLYGERSVRSHSARVVLEPPKRSERPRDERGRFLPRSPVERVGS